MESLYAQRGLGREWIREWLPQVPRLEAFLQLPEGQWQAELKNWPQELRKNLAPLLHARPWNRQPPTFLSFLHPDFPSRLQSAPDPPCGLYYRGGTEVLRAKGPWIGVVGTRHASELSIKACREILQAMAAYRPIIVSGMARGIDACAHQSALDLGLKTVGVLGTPVDRIYPRENAALFARMVGEGLLVSELSPFSELGAWRFPERNRLIAAFCEALLVLEAPPTSGALWTASFALDLGREIFVVPGPWGERHRGGHRLIQQGANLLTDPAEIFRTLGYKKRPVAKKKIPVEGELTESPPPTPEETRILSILRAGPAQIDKIAYLSQLPAPTLAVTLTGMVLREILRECSGKIYEINDEI